MDEINLIIVAIIAILELTFYIIVCNGLVNVAESKGHDRGHLFAICFWLGIPGMIYVASLPDLTLRKMISKKLVLDPNLSQDIENVPVSNKGNSDERMNPKFGDWRCAFCGEINYNYTHSCKCGKTREQTKQKERRLKEKNI